MEGHMKSAVSFIRIFTWIFFDEEKNYRRILL